MSLWKNLSKCFCVGLLTILLFQAASMVRSATNPLVQDPLQTTTYEAPIRPLHPNPEHIVPGYYVVFLYPSHSLEKHSKFIKTDLTPHIMSIFDRLYTDRIVYNARNVDEALLAAIRFDPGVEVVEYDFIVFPI